MPFALLFSKGSQQSTMVNCCVVGCNNNRKNSSETLHSFPRKDSEPARYKLWKSRVNRKNFTPNHNHKVCSVHFTADDFETTLKQELLPNEKVNRLLKRSAVPSLFLTIPNAEVKKRKTSKYVQKKIIDGILENQVKTSESDTSSLDRKSAETFLDINACEKSTYSIGIQCELGNEAYFMYSTLYDPDGSGSSFNTSEKLEMGCELTEEVAHAQVNESSSSEKDSSSDDDCDIQEENMLSARNSDTSYNFVLVHRDSLFSLFTHCHICGSPITSLGDYVKGAVVHVKYVCSTGHDHKWSSYGDSSKMTSHLSSALILNGMNFTTFKNFAKTLKLVSISSTTYYKCIKDCIAPVILDFWEKHKQKNFEEARQRDSISISGDGQYDSPGFSAKYVTYSIMDLKTNKILDFVLCQRGLVEGDLEKAACEKALEKVTKELPAVKLFLSDRHRGVGLLLRTKFPEIHHEFDVWHLAKSLMKKLSTAEKKSKLLSEWKRAITNHLWWSSETCQGNGDLAVKKFTSLLKHTTNIHEWTTEAGEKECCEHKPLSQDESESIKWIRIGSEDYQTLYSTVMNKTFLNDLRHASHFCHTSSLESYHNVRLKYVPKRIHFSYRGMFLRSILAIIDNNYNVGRPVVGGDVQYSKSIKQWHYKNKYREKTDEWRSEIRDTILHFNDCSLLPDEPEYNRSLPKNIYNTEKPTILEAKAKHTSRFSRQNSK